MSLSIKKRIASVIGISMAAIVVAGGTASAHVTVKPAVVSTASRHLFTVGVPTEGQSPTVEVRLVIPSGVTAVTPTVKAGWNIDVAREGDGEESRVKEITWNNGNVPAGMRDEFTFTAQMPADATDLAWKAYQTYADGRVVSWDQDPTQSSHGHDGGDAGPFSVTKVSEDGDASAVSESGVVSSNSTDSRGNIALAVSVIALVLAVVAFTQGMSSVPVKAAKSKKR